MFGVELLHVPLEGAQPFVGVGALECDACLLVHVVESRGGANFFRVLGGLLLFAPALFHPLEFLRRFECVLYHPVVVIQLLVYKVVVFRGQAPQEAVEVRLPEWLCETAEVHIILVDIPDDIAFVDV